jgi:hypothetical protein
MKICGHLVDLLLETCPGMYDDFVVYERRAKHKIVYVKMLKALYGMLTASILFYNKFVSDIKTLRFELNPYDPCFANHKVNGKQHTVTWHVNNMKSSHIDPRVNNKFYKWCENKYGNSKVGHAKVVYRPKHNYLAIILDYSVQGKLKINREYYIDTVIEEFPYKIKMVKSMP